MSQLLADGLSQLQPIYYEGTSYIQVLLGVTWLRCNNMSYDDITCVISLWCHHSQVTPRTTHTFRGRSCDKRFPSLAVSHWQTHTRWLQLLHLEMNIESHPLCVHWSCHQHPLDNDINVLIYSWIMRPALFIIFKRANSHKVHKCIHEPVHDLGTWYDDSWL